MGSEFLIGTAIGEMLERVEHAPRRDRCWLAVRSTKEVRRVTKPRRSGGLRPYVYWVLQVLNDEGGEADVETLIVGFMRS
jgi:hypothetical protein